MEKKKDAQKETNDLQELCVFSANVTSNMRKSGTKTTPNHRNMVLERFPWRLDAKAEKASQNSPQRRRKGAEKEPWP